MSWMMHLVSSMATGEWAFTEAMTRSVSNMAAVQAGEWWLALSNMAPVCLQGGTGRCREKAGYRPEWCAHQRGALRLPQREEPEWRWWDGGPGAVFKEFRELDLCGSSSFHALWFDLRGQNLLVSSDFHTDRFTDIWYLSNGGIVRDFGGYWFNSRFI